VRIVHPPTSTRGAVISAAAPLVGQWSSSLQECCTSR
jgi:hypothetical protein